MKRILVMGMSDSIWLRSYLKHVFGEQNEEYEIIVFGEYDSNLFDFCNKRCLMFVYPMPVPRIILAIPLLRGIVYRVNYFFRIFQIRRKYPLDAVHLHYVNKAKLKAAKILRKRTKRIICTYWGSDLLRKKQVLLEEEKKYFCNIDVFTFATEEMCSYFCKKYGEEYYDRSRIVRFGIETLNEIDKLQNQTINCKKQFGFPLDKIIVSVGYNGSRLQQHVKIIDILNSLSEDVIKKIYVVIPMQYGIEAGYKEELETYLKTTRFEYNIIYNYTDTRQTASLRMATDYFIHGQISDAFSASVQEYLYAGKIVFNPSWLSYPLIKDGGGYYCEYTSFDDLKNLLDDFFAKSLEECYLSRLQRNHDIIYNLSSWEIQKYCWQQLYG